MTKIEDVEVGEVGAATCALEKFEGNFEVLQHVKGCEADVHHDFYLLLFHDMRGGCCLAIKRM